ncbi:diphthamide biosynthesis enzyme Dph2 [Desulfurococcus mucosus]|uniref:2-(3-amino-3-carboxypropyl)histidine synthase n=1 Tax=Desulfurococcus mucosus (strain ATCC 35584 / DSM 2162 / JCM 9187 / O7/1) TaxID=765177 RepID=E8RAE6_DESM0|nr:diphthamide biosynthesis enzyme Dph2 [Desulfurococcus mucosus]ADV64356.1 diphthamide biosynthesis protein [Desulfurococcus mucosus DSM 2162]
MSDICSLYDIDLDALTKQVSKSSGRVLLHAPDGLKPLYNCIAPVLEQAGVEAAFSASPGYGACDIPFEEAEAIGADLLVHIGHLEYFQYGFKPAVKVLYIPVYRRPYIEQGLLRELVETLREAGVVKVSVSSTLVEEKIRRVVANHLASNGFKPIEVGFPVLGCLYTHVTSLDTSVDAHLMVAGGVFHPLGLALVSKKPVVVLDPYRGRVWRAGDEASRVLKQRLMRVFEARNSGNRVGVIVGSRPGQYRPWLVEKIEEEAAGRGYRVYRIISGYLTLERLIAVDNALGLDVYVVTSCPRLPIDDLSEFYKPVLTPGEFMMLLKDAGNYIYPW